MRALTIALCLTASVLCVSVAQAARVRPLALPVDDQRVLDRGAITGATTASSAAGDVAVLWRNGDTVRLATRAVGGRFFAPLVLPGAASAENSSLEGPVVGVGGGVLATWRNGTPEDGETLQVAVADPGRAPGLLAPLATPGGAGESPRAEWRTTVSADGTAMMAVERGDAVRVTERRLAGGFGPEVVVSAPGELPELTSVRMIRDDAGGVIVTWTSKMPCVALAAARCLINRVSTRAAGAAGFGVPQSLAEIPTGLTPVPRVPTPQIQQPFAAADGAGRTALAWRRNDPGRFDGVEVSLGSASRGFAPRVVLPGRPSGLNTASGPPPCGRIPGTPYLAGALPAAGGGEVLLTQVVTGCGSSIQAFTIGADGSVAGARVLASGIGSHAATVLRRGPRAALLIQSRRTIRVAFAQPDGTFTALRRVGPKATQRFTGPGAIMRDGSVIVEYGRGCGPGRGANSEIAVVKPRSVAQTTRRIAPCGARAPTLIDSRGALVTMSLDGASPDSALLQGSATCPIPAALTAQRAHRRAACR